MNRLDKTGEKSMEEILASIRRTIAEEPIDLRSNAQPVSKSSPARAESTAEESPEFDLPSILKPPVQSARARTVPTVGRLADALRGVPGPATGSDQMSRADDFTSRSGISPAPSAINPSSSIAAPPGLMELQQWTQQANTSPPFTAPAAEKKPAEPSTVRPSNIAASAPPPAQPANEVKRVMAPFKDTRMVQMAAHTEPSHRSEPIRPSSSPPPPAAYAAPTYAAPTYVAPTPPSMDTGVIPVVQPSLAVNNAGPPALRLPGLEGVIPAALHEARPSGLVQDSAAELLRPMLRQWLADNMPRIVEQALHIEVAESVKHGPKSDGT